ILACIAVVGMQSEASADVAGRRASFDAWRLSKPIVERPANPGHIKGRAIRSAHGRNAYTNGWYNPVTGYVVYHPDRLPPPSQRAPAWQSRRSWPGFFGRIRN
ncbi:MAG: hypothetical protein KDD69_19420, partial [Bdellovibrionales bacterium]|nr:hypothetical protein [Bdellovibrionales bacterium]